MQNGRKRKGSTEHIIEDNPLKKLKSDDDNTLCGPATSKAFSAAKAKLSSLLPDGYESIIVTASTKPDDNIEGDETLFGCVRLPIVTKEDAVIWVKRFEKKTYTTYRTQKTWKNDANTGLFRRKFLCNYRSSDEAGGVYSCKACLIFTIKDPKEVQTNPDYYLRDHPSQVIIQFCHNHKIDHDEYSKNIRPSTELRVIFSTYFSNGHSPFSSLVCHKCDLHSSYGSEFYDVVSNGGIFPSYSWCYREFEKIMKHKYIEPGNDELINKLSEVIAKYNANCHSEFVTLLKDPLVLIVCTPLMKSVFKSGFAEELITIRSFCTPKTISKRQKVILFLCHTPIGSLPFGVVVTSADDSDSIRQGIKSLLAILGVPSYGPKTIITDENSMLSKCLINSFPKSQVVFNEFNMLQSIWRIIRLVCEDDNEEFQAVYNLFFVTLNSETEEDFKRNFDSLLVYAEKYPKLSSFLKYFKVRSNSYVLYARPKVEFNTDVLNYTDSGTVILQDVSMKYANFFNILQLFDFLTKNYVKHYERKLRKIINGDLKGFFKTTFFVPLSKIGDFTCEKIGDTEFLVSLNDIKFFVNAELDTCTCQVGVHGGSCVHQYIVEKNLGLVPECYTPLEEEMLNIFKAILSYQGITQSNLDAAKTSIENNTNEFNLSLGNQDVENITPVDEIFHAPTEIPDFLSYEDLGPLQLSDFEDLSNDESDEFSNDVAHYNRESGELELIEPFIGNEYDISKEVPSRSDEQVVSSTHDPKSQSEKAIAAPERMIELEAKNENVTSNIEDSRETENDKKTAEIAEFLTNLPSTNNRTSTDPVISATGENTDSSKGTNSETKQLHKQLEARDIGGIVPEGVLVMKNHEFFTQYRVMDNGVLSVITDTDEEYPNRINTFQQSTEQNFMRDSYEESGMMLMSPTDIFDTNENVGNVAENTGETVDPKINVLSTVVIKPSEPVISVPLNLNTIRNKTLRNVKEENRNRMQQADKQNEELLNKPKESNSQKNSEEPVPCSSRTLDTNDSNERGEGLSFTEYDSQSLANETLPDIVEMDSDDLAELAAQEYNTSKNDSSNITSSKSMHTNASKIITPPMRIIPIKSLPSKYMPKVTTRNPTAKTIPLQALTSRKPLLLKKDKETVGVTKERKKKDTSEPESLEAQLTSVLSQLTSFGDQDSFQKSVKKFIGKFKELGKSDKLLDALNNFGEEHIDDKLFNKSQFKNKKYLQRNLPKKYPYDDSSDMDDHESENYSSDRFDDSESIGSSAFEHYSECRTSCSDFHSELECVDDSSDYEPGSLQSPKQNQKINITLPQSITVRKVNDPVMENDSLADEQSKKSAKNDQKIATLKLLQNRSHLCDTPKDYDSSRLIKQDMKWKMNFRHESKKAKAHSKKYKKGIDVSHLMKVVPGKRLNSQPQTNIDRPAFGLSPVYKIGSGVSVVRVQKPIPKKPKSSLNKTNLGKLNVQPEKKQTHLNKQQSMQKKIDDAELLENILSGKPDDESDITTSNHQNTNLVKLTDNEDLSFLFNDSRFEPILLENENSNNDISTVASKEQNSSTSLQGAKGHSVNRPQKGIQIKHEYNPRKPIDSKIRQSNEQMNAQQSSVNITIPQMFYFIPPDIDPKTLKLLKENNAVTMAEQLPNIKSIETLTKGAFSHDNKVKVKVENEVKDLELLDKKSLSKENEQKDQENNKTYRSQNASEVEKSQQNKFDKAVVDACKLNPVRRRGRPKKHSNKSADMSNHEDTQQETATPVSQKRKGAFKISVKSLARRDSIVTKTSTPKPNTKTRPRVSNKTKRTPKKNDSLTKKESQDEFDTSITASILNKADPLTSTPVKNAGYEDMFKEFLASPDRNVKSLPNYEKYSNNSDTKSKTLMPKSNSVPFVKQETKSFDWADTIKVGEPFQIDSDDSEIEITPSKHRKILTRTRLASKPPQKSEKFSRQMSKNRSGVSQKQAGRKSIHGNDQKILCDKSSPKSSKLELIVLLNRNIEIELKCEKLRKESPQLARSGRGVRRGYKELLEMAKSLKY